MAATPITASTRFLLRGTTKTYFLTASSSTPTRGELNAGTDLSPEIFAADGWEITSGTVETPDQGSLFTDKIGGPLEVGEPTLSCYASKNGVDARTLLPRGTTGFLVIMWGGDVAGYKGDKFPVSVRSVGKPYDLGDTAALVNIGFTITDEPVEDFTIPA